MKFRVGTLAEGDTERICSEWNLGAYDVLLVHPRSAGHGLNLAQGGSHIVWLGPQWSRDLKEQTNARLSIGGINAPHTSSIP